ncbi:MAG: HU family DNA-binding protein [Candidatus Eutrophobiaceae bacterium]
MASSKKAYDVRQTKAQIINSIAEETELTRAQVRAVLISLAEQARRHLMKRGGVGEFMIPDMGVKLRRIEKPARKARKGINPFTKEEIMIKAKRATKSVRVVALKAAKEMVN